ncbi:uncharacterized protein LOC136035855 [Artemia franciscana]|uniref:uncharacterized protein LOC136035855 n=1 Tax=Artemia franciscana TaxID=6661 RepID=UPI0032DB95EF
MRTKEDETYLNETWSPSYTGKVKANYYIADCIFLGEISNLTTVLQFMSKKMPKTLLYLSGIMALALCAPPSAREESRTSTNQAQILKQINHVNDDGLYTFGYEAGNSTFKAKETMSLPSTDENFSPDADKNGIQGTLENAIPNLKAVLNPTLVAPVVGPVHAAAPVPHQQQIAPIFTLARQTSDTNNQSDPSAIIKQAPQGYQFSFVAPTQNTKMEHLNQARTLLHTLPQLVIGQFQSNSFQPQSFYFSPQYTSFN